MLTDSCIDSAVLVHFFPLCVGVCGHPFCHLDISSVLERWQFRGHNLDDTLAPILSSSPVLASGEYRALGSALFFAGRFSVYETFSIMLCYWLWLSS